MSTVIHRKCKTCGYYLVSAKGRRGWCHWLGAPRNGDSYECEDGYKKKETKKS